MLAKSSLMALEAPGRRTPSHAVADGGALLSDPYFLMGEQNVAHSEPDTWLAPEQRGAVWQERYETDVHGCGLIMGFCLAGRSVTPGESLIEQGLSVSSDLDQVFLRSTRSKPEERYENVSALRKELEGALLASEPNSLKGASISSESESNDVGEESTAAVISGDEESTGAIVFDEN